MTDPITPATIARLRELLRVASNFSSQSMRTAALGVLRNEAAKALPALLDQLASQAAEIERVRAEKAESIATARLDLLVDCLEHIGLRDERGLWDGGLSTAEELIEHLEKAGRLVRVAGEGPERWEWGGSGWPKGPDSPVQNEVYDNTSIWYIGDLLRMAKGQRSKERTEAKP